MQFFAFMAENSQKNKFTNVVENENYPVQRRSILPKFMPFLAADSLNPCLFLTAESQMYREKTNMRTTNIK